MEDISNATATSSTSLEVKKRGKASTPTSSDSIEPELEQKRAKSSKLEISNSSNYDDTGIDTEEDDNVRKKLASQFNDKRSF